MVIDVNIYGFIGGSMKYNWTNVKTAYESLNLSFFQKFGVLMIRQIEDG